MKCLISIIVPVYNTEKYLHRCIDSILAQTYQDFELLLIDDGSKDSSGAICDEYAAKDARVRVFHKENGGVSSARNVGLDNARGEWITFVDADDWVDDCWLQSINSEVYSHSDTDIIRYGYHCYNEEGVYLESVRAECTMIADNPEQFIVYSESNKYYEMVWNSAFRTTLVSNIRFRTDIQWSEDYLFMYECFACARKMLILDCALYHYRNRTDGLSGNVSPEVILRAIGDNYSACIPLLKSSFEKRKKKKNYLYHSSKAVSMLYTDKQTTYDKRVELSRIFVRKNKVLLPPLLFVFAYLRPFILSDLILTFIFQIKKIKHLW